MQCGVPTQSSSAILPRSRLDHLKMFSRFFVGCLLLAASRAWCADVTVSLGAASSHDGRTARVGEISGTIDANDRVTWLKRLGINRYELMAGWIDSRPLRRLDRSTRFVGLGVRRHAGRWFAGAGIALVDNMTDALSSRLQFVTSGGVVVGPATITLRHLSNAGLRGPNRGETYLAVGYTW